MLSLSAQPAKYTGPGSCASPSCHGGVQARADTSVWQNEYSTWVVKDKHAQAYVALRKPLALRMAKILGRPQPDTDQRCLACHALDVAADQRAKTFDIVDGVSCENCHGPASNWLGPHTTQGWTHQQSVAVGMIDLRDLAHRSEGCLACHLGTREKFVDHELIAAGHPDLYFELASFSAVMPRHWKQPVDKEPWLEVRVLAVGQAVQLREELNRLGRNGPQQYAELDCFACHHSLTDPKDSWRQDQGYPGRRAGNPPWNLSRYAVFRQVASEVDRATAQQLEAGINKLYAMVGAGDGSQIASQTAATADIADRLARRLNGAVFDPASALRLLKGISADADYISMQGERAAEQAAMALDSIFVVYSTNQHPANAEQVRTAIHGLFDQLQSPSAYDAPRFAQQMRTVNGLLP